MPTRAVVREVSASFAEALTAAPPDPPIDVARARSQHAAYRDALAAAGLTVVTVPGDDTCPDACFVEDTAVVAAGLAVMARPGAPSRRGEIEPVARVLEGFVAVQRIGAPATLDGGDCLRLGGTVYVGLSTRTNVEGVEQLARLFGPRGVRVVPVPLPEEILHLKCVASPLDDGRVLLAEGTLPPSTFPGARIVWVPAGESYAANAVAIRDRVLMADGFPRAREAVEAAGYRVTALDTGELRKADGALTCLSILLEA